MSMEYCRLLSLSILVRRLEHRSRLVRSSFCLSVLCASSGELCAASLGDCSLSVSWLSCGSLAVVLPSKMS